MEAINRNQSIIVSFSDKGIKKAYLDDMKKRVDEHKKKIRFEIKEEVEGKKE